jgi:hypothetical protein
VTKPRIALIGARRVRQGLGPFVARDLASAGVDVVAVLGTSPESAASAAIELADRFGIVARPHTRLDDAIARESIDALAILSPPATHEPYLRAALAHRLHVLCEKPLIWGGADFAGRGCALVDGFRASGLLLEENCQWPRALEAFRALHPEWDSRTPQRFFMLLAPAETGIDALRDSLSHPLSLLQALCPEPAPRLENIRFERASGGPAKIRVAFVFHAGVARVDCSVELLADQQVPRPAAFEIDGLRAERHIRLPDYRMELADGARAVPLPDPLTRHLAEFATQLRSAIAGKRPADPEPIAERLTLLGALVDACPIELKRCAD